MINRRYRWTEYVGEGMEGDEIGTGIVDDDMELAMILGIDASWDPFLSGNGHEFYKTSQNTTIEVEEI